MALTDRFTVDTDNYSTPSTPLSTHPRAKVPEGTGAPDPLPAPHLPHSRAGMEELGLDPEQRGRSARWGRWTGEGEGRGRNGLENAGASTELAGSL